MTYKVKIRNYKIWYARIWVHLSTDNVLYFECSDGRHSRNDLRKDDI